MATSIYIKTVNINQYQSISVYPSFITFSASIKISAPPQKIKPLQFFFQEKIPDSGLHRMAEGMDLCLGDSDVKEEPKPLMDGTTVTATAPWPGGWFVYSSHVFLDQQGWALKDSVFSCKWMLFQSVDAIDAFRLILKEHLKSNPKSPKSKDLRSSPSTTRGALVSWKFLEPKRTSTSMAGMLDMKGPERVLKQAGWKLETWEFDDSLETEDWELANRCC